MGSMRVSISSWKQAKKDKDKSAKNPVRRLSDMLPEERQRVIDETMNTDRERAKRQAIKASGLMPSTASKEPAQAEAAPTGGHE